MSKQYKDTIEGIIGRCYPQRLYWNTETKTWACRFYDVGLHYPRQRREHEVVVTTIRYSGDIPTYRQALELRREALEWL